MRRKHEMEAWMVRMEAMEAAATRRTECAEERARATAAVDEQARVALEAAGTDDAFLLDTTFPTNNEVVMIGSGDASSSRQTTSCANSSTLPQQYKGDPGKTPRPAILHRLDSSGLQAIDATYESAGRHGGGCQGCRLGKLHHDPLHGNSASQGGGCQGCRLGQLHHDPLYGNSASQGGGYQGCRLG